MKLRLFAVMGLMLLGCANPYAKFYYDQTGGVDLTKSPRVILPTEKPKLFSGVDVDSDHIRMLEDGFGLVGFSSFNAGDGISVKAALEQATRVHAAIVLVYSKYTDTVSGMAPMTLPDVQTSRGTVSGSVMAPGGMATYSGSIYSTTYGTRTTYIPYSVNRYDYVASYWIKFKPPIFGIVVAELSPEIKQRIGSNRGVVVIAVMKGSVAFINDILRGDVIRRIGDVEVLDPEKLYETVARYAGRKVSVTFLRDGKELTKEVIFDNAR